MASTQKKAKRLVRVVHTFEEFVKSQSFSGVLLIICTIIAITWANSRFSSGYYNLNHLHFGFAIEGLVVHKTLQHWVNDGLMAIFFLLVGLEIKREMIAGELSILSRALLPIFAAIGGMAVPAVIFALLNLHHIAALRGWAIPMATDIAFSLGVLALLGKRVPSSLVIFLTAIAIVDDLGAVSVIAVFYNKHLALMYLGLAFLALMILIALNYFGVRKLTPYVFFGLLMWFFMLQSGVHATVAGVLLAFTIPGRSKYNAEDVSYNLQQLQTQFDKIRATSQNHLENVRQQGVLHTMRDLVEEVETPLQRLEHQLHLPVNYFIIPIFVLFNAGVSLTGTDLHLAIVNSITLGIAAGLVIGKLVGIAGTTWLVSSFKWIKLPPGISMRQIIPLSLIAGIGFTMSIFISELAYSGSNDKLVFAKLGILLGSLIAAITGFVLMLLFTKPKKING